MKILRTIRDFFVGIWYLILVSIIVTPTPKRKAEIEKLIAEKYPNLQQ